MFLEGKSWITQDYYNEYLNLKEEIFKYASLLECKDDVSIQEKLDEKVNRMKYVLGRLKENGVAMGDLILLSLGVDVE